jgi:hypothetical protein
MAILLKERPRSQNLRETELGLWFSSSPLSYILSVCKGKILFRNRIRKGTINSKYEAPANRRGRLTP